LEESSPSRYLKTARAGAEAVHTFRRRLRRELDQVPFKLPKRTSRLRFGIDRHMEIERIGKEEKYRLICEKAIPKSWVIFNILLTGFC